MRIKLSFTLKKSFRHVYSKLILFIFGGKRILTGATSVPTVNIPNSIALRFLVVHNLNLELIDTSLLIVGFS